MKRPTYLPDCPYNCHLMSNWERRVGWAQFSPETAIELAEMEAERPWPARAYLFRTEVSF